MKKLMTFVRTTEVDDLSDRLLQIYAAETALKNDSFLKPLFAEMQTLSDQITEAIKKDKVLSDLDDADGARDEAVKKLFKIVEGYAAMPIENFSTPAAGLKTLLGKFGLGITRASYASESSLIEAMLQDLTAMQTEVAALPGVAESISAIRDAQSVFNSKRISYTSNLSADRHVESASTIKKPLLELINTKLVPYLETMKMVDAEKFGRFADTVEQSIDSANITIKTRSSRKESKSDELKAK